MQFSLIELWQAMGLLARGVVFVLLGMSLLSFAVAVEKWLTLSRTTKAASLFLRAWRERLQTQGHLAAAAAAEQHPHSPHAQLVKVGAKLLHDATDLHRQLEAYDRAVRREILTVGATVRQGLDLLATVGSTAPFVGLFGTVVGIVNAFQKMAGAGQGGLSVVSAGIAEALVTTALGIGVAIPAVWLFNATTQRISRLLTELEGVAGELAVAALSASPSVAGRLSSPGDQQEHSDGATTWQR